MQFFLYKKWCLKKNFSKYFITIYIPTSLCIYFPIISSFEGKDRTYKFINFGFSQNTHRSSGSSEISLQEGTAVPSVEGQAEIDQEICLEASFSSTHFS